MFEAKFGPKMDPRGLRKRVRKTVGNIGGQRCLFKASGVAENEEKRSSAGKESILKGAARVAGKKANLTTTSNRIAESAFEE